LTVVLDAVSAKVAITATRMIATTTSRTTIDTGNAGGTDASFTGTGSLLGGDGALIIR